MYRRYRLELETWPDATTASLVASVEQIRSVAEKLHQAGSNWYRIFRLVDADSSGKMDYAEFSCMLRRPLPCLAIKTDVLPDKSLKALWKAMDADQDGIVSLKQF